MVDKRLFCGDWASKYAVGRGWSTTRRICDLDLLITFKRAQGGVTWTGNE